MENNKYTVGTKVIMKKKIKKHLVDVEDEEFASIGGVG